MAQATGATDRRRAVFALDEGDVEILFPGDLSRESVSDLSAYIAIWLRILERDPGPKRLADRADAGPPETGA